MNDFDVVSIGSVAFAGIIPAGMLFRSEPLLYTDVYMAIVSIVMFFVFGIVAMKMSENRDE